MVDRDGVPWVPIPAQLGRRLRLGPFPSGRDAIKFVTAATVGAVASLLLVPWAGLPIVVGGAVVALWHPDGEPVDERLAALLQWAVRHGRSAKRMTRTDRSAPLGPGDTVTLSDGRSAAIVQTSGVPIAFLPPAELQDLFARYRDLLRSLELAWVAVATAVPIHGGSVVPAARPEGPSEREARDGYAELVGLLARRRSIRRVFLAIVQEEAGPSGARRLDSAASLVSDRLSDLGVRVARLRGRALADAAVRLGLTRGEGSR